ncbi:hypothetical protein [Arcticibacterium luteifluviistationis]|uniref:Uncharacterized protein n=1 Tax=Arcticibacterium luteifluviistationis TaxID=1784714 RepID=A0A2Z4G7K8_9BACT|nr:hypothetical protein [Arcticibacterium luteifluviistationis]AWV97142.1 hypothetical protein DJ013_02715 [Arcticibacterium luteifluviistationis]
MKIKLLFILLLFAMISCDGTLGGFESRSFNTPKQNIKRAIDTLFATNNELKIPEKWNEHDDWEDRGFGFLDTRIFYFQSEPEEMYYVSFVENGNEKQDENGPTILAIRSIFTKRHNNWLKEEDFDDMEKERIETRFDTEIISKLENYSGVKAVRKN